SFPEVLYALYDLARMRTASYSVRVILLAPSDLRPGQVTQNLVLAGYHDIVLPALFPAAKAETEPYTEVAKLLRTRATFKYAYDRGLVNARFIDQLQKPSPAPGEEPQAQGAKRRSIAVAGVTPRCGCTTFALTLASSLAIAGKDVSIYMNERDHRALSAVFSGTANEQGAMRLRSSKGRKGIVDIYPILNMAPTVHTADRNPFTIYDLGTAPVDALPEKPSPAEQRRAAQAEAMLSRWLMSRDRVFVSGGGADDIFDLGRSASELRKRGVSADIFVNLCAEDAFGVIKDGMKEIQGLEFFRMEAVYGPLYITEMPSWLRAWTTARDFGKLKGKD
ncbi:MAG: hypothetical protein IKF96_05170, partial [Eggerthellaceae bacterium]|nr:hypothetical protein [Eggerthellaceae bacterium]